MGEWDAWHRGACPFPLSVRFGTVCVQFLFSNPDLDQKLPKVVIEQSSFERDKDSWLSFIMFCFCHMWFDSSDRLWLVVFFIQLSMLFDHLRIYCSSQDRNNDVGMERNQDQGSSEPKWTSRESSWIYGSTLSSEAKWCSQRPRWLWFWARGTHVIMSRPCSMPTFFKYHQISNISLC